MKPGGVLHTSKPYVHAIYPSERGRWCEQCIVGLSINNQGTPPKKCTKCKVVFYCSVECQKEDWTFHKLECKRFRRVSPWIPDEYIILFSRLLQRYNRGEHKTVSETICGRKVVFNDLVHHVEEIQKDEGLMILLYALMISLKRFLGGCLAFPTQDEMLKMYGRVLVNFFRQPQRFELFLSFSVIDHSCRPNAIIGSGGERTLRTLIDVPDNALETYCNDIRISYIHLMNLTEERRSTLRKRFYFTCECPMCSDQHMDALMQSIKCPQPNCDGPLIRQEAGQDHVCTTCNAKFPEHSGVIKKYNSLVTTTKSTLLELEELNDDQSEELFNKSVELLKLQENTFHKMNVYRVNTLSKAVDGARETERYEKGREYALATLDAYKHYCGRYHPQLGSHLMMIGLSLFRKRQLREAFDFLQRAESIMDVTHCIADRDYDFLKQTLDKCFQMLIK